MKHNTLRHYQLSHVNRILRQVATHNEAALVSCVGSGKTLTASVVGSEAMGRGIVNRVICATPFTTIAEEFKRYTGSHWASNAQNNSQFTVRPIVEDEGVKHVADVVKCSDEFLVTTHAAMANKKVLKAIEDAEDLSGLLLMIDEAHHCFSSEDEEEDKDGTLLGVAARKILAKGGKVLYITATPYRNFGGTTNLIFDPNLCNPVVRTIGEQMREGLAPAMHVEYLHVQDMTLANAGQSVLFGDGVSTRIGDTQLKHALPIIREKWIADGCPKAILIIPAGNSEHTAKAVANYFTAQGFPEEVATVRGRGTPNVLEAVGTDKQRILAGLTADKEACGHMLDLVIACRKFDEGTDVNTASHLYMIGLPSNVRLFHQRAGRVLRDKKGIPGYDAWFGTAWNDQSRVVFFAPAGKKTKEFDFKVGRQLLHCIFAAESYQEYCEALNFSQSIRIEFENEDVPEEDKSLVDDLMARLADIELSSMKDQASDEYELLVGSTLNPGETVLDKVNQIKSDTSLSAEDKAKAYSLLLNHLPEGYLGAIDVAAVVKSLVAKAKAKKFVKDEAADTFDLTPSELICEEFEEILQRFNTAKVASTADVKAKSVYTEIAGGDFQEWAFECRRYMGENGAIGTTVAALEFYRKNGFYPRHTNTDPQEHDLAKRVGTLKLAKAGISGSTWYPKCEELVLQSGLPPLFINRDREGEAREKGQEILQWIAAYGRVPSKDSSDKGEAQLGRNRTAWMAAKYGEDNRSSGGMIWYPTIEEDAREAGYPDLYTRIDTYASNTQKLIAWVRANKKYPKNHSKLRDPEQAGLATFFKRSLEREGFIDILKDAGVLHFFNERLLSPEEKDRKFLEQIKEYEDREGRRPDGKHPLSAKIGAWRKDLRGLAGHTVRPGTVALAETMGLSWVFDISEKEYTLLEKCIVVTSHMDRKHRIPDALARKESNPEEYQALRFYRDILSAAHDNVLEPECLQLLKSTGYEDLVEIGKDGKRRLAKLVAYEVEHGEPDENDKYMMGQVLSYAIKNGKLPVQSGNKSVKAPSGQKLGTWIATCRAKRSDGRLHRKILQAVASAGYPDMFEKEDIDQGRINRCKEAIAFRGRTGRFPSTTSKDKEERALGVWLSGMRRAAKGDSMGGKGTMLPPCKECMSLAAQAGYHDMFETTDFRKEGLERVHKLISWTLENSRFPSAKSKNPEERFLGTLRSNMIRSKNVNGSGAFFPEYQEAAERAGLPKLFERVGRQ